MIYSLFNDLCLPHAASRSDVTLIFCHLAPILITACSNFDPFPMCPYLIQSSKERADFFQDAGVAADPYMAAILTSFIRLIGSLGAALMVNRFSRKLLMAFSAAVMTISMLSLGGV